MIDKIIVSGYNDVEIKWKFSDELATLTNLWEVLHNEKTIVLYLRYLMKIQMREKVTVSLIKGIYFVQFK